MSERFKDIINAGLEKAASAFAMIIKREVKVKKIKVRIGVGDEKLFISDKVTNEDQILITPLIGESNGKSFLIFDAYTAGLITALCHSGHDKLLDKNAVENILLEIDNILSATFITEISNQLEISIFGDVPKITVKEALEADTEMDAFIFIESEFDIEKDEMANVSFLWMLEGELLKKVS
ncbi:hypothetical protein [Mangrovivirga cuniculi]|uniref:Chemotaxis phosphatase CheX-like domain-containing protein n=1 Tax=Mangrovivirga cuniculi TaxID=2715131 RepID=A0A4D7JT26_9BACT|nr:hypothetical protein [Mangrovivirga cuniculi]QCK16660.1 hypothetical protein DCC35_18945 [Mangrovivirga cuniculi]